MTRDTTIGPAAAAEQAGRGAVLSRVDRRADAQPTFHVDASQAMAFRRAVGDVHALIRQSLDARLAGHGVTAGQCAVLHAFRRQPDAGMVDVGERLRIDAPSLSRLVGRLEAKGLCLRFKARGDRRAARVELLAPGIALADAYPALQSEVTELVLTGFDAAERALLFAGMNRLLDAARLFG
jgi:DNA-binding MarR family transcriptional regulator